MSVFGIQTLKMPATDHRSSTGLLGHLCGQPGHGQNINSLVGPRHDIPTKKTRMSTKKMNWQPRNGESKTEKYTIYIIYIPCTLPATSIATRRPPRLPCGGDLYYMRLCRCANYDGYTVRRKENSEKQIALPQTLKMKRVPKY